jgi:hypothetical protein
VIALGYNAWHRNTDVTITTPLLPTQERMTCAGFTLRRFAASSMGLSTGPPGVLVIDLCGSDERSATETRNDISTYVREL